MRTNNTAKIKTWFDIILLHRKIYETWKAANWKSSTARFRTYAYGEYFLNFFVAWKNVGTSTNQEKHSSFTNYQPDKIE